MLNSGNLNYRRGQVGIIILLIVVVMSTIGISIASRSSTDVTISKSSEDANRAFDAAQSGAEQALSGAGGALDATNSQPVSGSINSVPNLSINYTVTKSTTLGAVVDEGYSTSLDFTNGAPPASGGSIVINWATQANCAANPASLIITVYAKPGTSPLYRKIYAGACVHANDGFTTASAGSSGYLSQVSVPLLSTDLLVRIRPVYAQTTLQVTSVGWTLPVQQFKVVSTGQSTINKETKTFQIDRSLPSAPSVLDFSLFAGGEISNN